MKSIRILSNRPEFKWFLESYYLVECSVSTSPIELAEKIEDFDVLIFGDCHRKKFDEEPDCLKKIITAVTNGVSMLYYGGWGSYGVGGYANSTLAKILPVNILENDHRYQRHNNEGADVVTLGKYFGQGIDFGRFQLPTSYHIIESPKDGSTVFFKSKEDEQKYGMGRQRIPLAIFQDFGQYRIFCVTMSLIGGGAKELMIWEQFPLLLKSCLEELSGDEIPARPYAEDVIPFKEFMRSFREADNIEKDQLLHDGLTNLWFENFKVDQYRFIGDLAGKMKSKFAAISRSFMLPHLMPNSAAYRKCEAEMYKYKARSAGNGLRFSEAAFLFGAASAAQKRLEDSKKSETVIWSHYFKGMGKLCETMNLMTSSPLNISAALDASEESLHDFQYYSDEVANNVPEHKLQVKYLAEFIETILRFHRFCRTPLQRMIYRFFPPSQNSDFRVLRKERIHNLIERLSEFSGTYDECPNWADKIFVGFLSEALKLVVKFSRKNVQAFCSKATEVPEVYSSPEQYWKPLFLSSIKGLFKETLFRTSWRRLLEESTGWLGVTALIAISLSAVLGWDTVQEWIKQSAAIQLSGFALVVGIIAGILALLSILVRHISGK